MRMPRIRRVAIALLLASLPVAAAVWLRPRQDSRPGMAEFQGRWTLLINREDAASYPKPLLDSMALFVTLFDGDRMMVIPRNQPYVVGLLDQISSPSIASTIKVDPSTDPKSIDLTNFRGKTTRGIYAFDGPRLKLCLPKPGAKRPVSFSDEGCRLKIYERDAAAPDRRNADRAGESRSILGQETRGRPGLPTTGRAGPSRPPQDGTPAEKDFKACIPSGSSPSTVAASAARSASRSWPGWRS
ncbi:TIGR03067 domain-containing protein [Tundrisphaera sp. TA3]|uniref:TIGR03067 domain-containing protein n=1 Tax=Tundrisphaera sp. TA3 TaxID=3435775 RepID=UPI003EC09203